MISKTADKQEFEEGDLLFCYYSMNPVVVGRHNYDGWFNCFEYDKKSGLLIDSNIFNGERLCSLEHAVRMGWMTKEQVTEFQEEQGSDVVL